MNKHITYQYWVVLDCSLKSTGLFGCARHDKKAEIKNQSFEAHFRLRMNGKSETKLEDILVVLQLIQGGRRKDRIPTQKCFRKERGHFGSHTMS